MTNNVKQIQGTEEIKDVIASRLDEQEATRLLQHLENGDDDWGDDRLEALVYQQMMHDFSKVDHGGAQVTQSEDTSFPEPIQKEAPAAAEHYFWCMLGMPGVERGLQPSGPVPFPLPQSKARPQPSSKQRTTPTPSRQSPSRPRMMLPRKRKRSSNTTPTHHKRQRSSTPEKVRPERPATEMLLEKIRGSMQGLLERNWVEEFSHQFPSREKLDAKMIEVIQEENSRQRPIVIDFASGSPQYALVLGSLDSAYPHCDVFHWKDAPAPLACKLCLSAGMERGGVRRMLSRFLQNKYHARWDPSETPQAWEDNREHQDNVLVRHIRHSHDTVSPVFEHGKHRGKHVKELVDDLLSGNVLPEDLTPFVCIKFGEEEYWAVFGNRRLKALKSFQDEADHDVRARCLVWSKEEAPASLVCKLAMSATTKNNGAFADFLDKRKGKGKGKRRGP